MKRNILLTILFFSAILVLVIVDPNNVANYSFTIPSTIVALGNIFSLSVIGFIVINVLPDSYLDNEYKNSNDTCVMIARSIHTLSIAIVFATILFTFYA